jgi:hypothetical protein
VAPVSDADRQSVRATHVVGDVRDVDAPERCCAGADLVFLASALIDLNPWTPHAARVHDVWPRLVPIMHIAVPGARQLHVDRAREHDTAHATAPRNVNGALCAAHVAFSVAPERHLNQYSLSKALAEQRVLAADDPRGLRTAALRPGHIYAPGDPMIEFAVALTRTPLLRHFWLVTRGTVHDVIYVENLAVAHILLARTLLARDTSASVAGQAFIVSDDAVNLNDQIAASFPRGALRPRFFVPRVVIYWIACLVELALYLCSLVGVAPHSSSRASPPCFARRRRRGQE